VIPESNEIKAADQKPRLTPEQIVQELDRYVVGQPAAKRAVAVALRTRDRRRTLPEDVRKEIMPKNILMIGPTGVGKTEIARRVAALVGAPFSKVEATRFTEVGYVGRDVESIVEDLTDKSFDVVHKESEAEVAERAEQAAIERLAAYLSEQYPSGRISTGGFHPTRPAHSGRQGQQAAATVTKAGSQGQPAAARSEGDLAAVPAPAGSTGPAQQSTERKVLERKRRHMARLLATRRFEDALVEVEVGDESDAFDSMLDFASGLTSDETYEDFNDFMARVQTRGQARYRRLAVRDARRVLKEQETEKLIDHEAVIDEAINRVEEMGVVFIDEMDKIAGPTVEVGRDVSGEGVQRDLLPIVEGTTVETHFGPVRTDHILFIAAGAFYKTKPSDLLPELQGRFPLRVELKSLSVDDFVRILSEPQNALTRQYQALLGTEDIKLEFTADGLRAVAEFACQMNERAENIGARRLATIMERLLEDVSFNAPSYAGQTLVVDAGFVRQRLEGLIEDENLSKYIL
jgi:ATP-dependent HslUV protease ATP-binding subunit HslU